jgi:hypothetical protein
MCAQCVTGRQRATEPDDGTTSHQPGAAYTGGILADEMGLGKTLQVRSPDSNTAFAYSCCLRALYGSSMMLKQRGSADNSLAHAALVLRIW